MDNNGKVLYVLTLILELPGVFIRRGLVAMLLFPFLFFSATRGIADWISLCVAWGPPVLSLLTIVIWPGGYTWTRFALGAREPSRRERDAVQSAFDRILASAPTGTRIPSHWFVIDQPLLNAYAIGEAVYLTRELIRSPHLTAVIAHELGHLNSADARLTLALRRLVLPPVFLLSNALGQAAPGIMCSTATEEDPGGCLAGGAVLFFAFLLALAGGGLGLLLLNPFLQMYWRQREYMADDFAARCGQAGALVAFLEDHQPLDVAVPYFSMPHPYTELRIDRLLQYMMGGNVTSSGAAATVAP